MGHDASDWGFRGLSSWYTTPEERRRSRGGSLNRVARASPSRAASEGSPRETGAAHKSARATRAARGPGRAEAPRLARPGRRRRRLSPGRARAMHRVSVAGQAGGRGGRPERPRTMASVSEPD